MFLKRVNVIVCDTSDGFACRMPTLARPATRGTKVKDRVDAERILVVDDEAASSLNPILI